MIQRSNLCCGIKLVMKLSHVGFHQSYRSLNKLQVMRRIMNIGAHTHTLSDTAYKCDLQEHTNPTFYYLDSSRFNLLRDMRLRQQFTRLGTVLCHTDLL